MTELLHLDIDIRDEVVAHRVITGSRAVIAQRAVHVVGVFRKTGSHLLPTRLRVVGGRRVRAHLNGTAVGERGAALGLGVPGHHAVRHRGLRGELGRIAAVQCGTGRSDGRNRQTVHGDVNGNRVGFATIDHGYNSGESIACASHSRIVGDRIRHRFAAGQQPCIRQIATVSGATAAIAIAIGTAAAIPAAAATGSHCMVGVSAGDRDSVTETGGIVGNIA